MSGEQGTQQSLEAAFGMPEAAAPALGSSGQSRSGGGCAPAPGPGEAVTPELLRRRWSGMTERANVLGFYGHSRGEFMCFSNFYDQKSQPFDFEVPEAFLARLGAPVPRVVSCTFSEKAIMLCKAAVMGDAEAYNQIVAAADPRKVKALGRRVRGWDEGLWSSVVCSVAFEVCYQKFSKTPSIQKVLLATGDRLIAEATVNDANWGIGINTGDPRVQTPAAWEGKNILGWALMEARAELRRSQRPAASREATAAEESEVIEVEGSADDGCPPSKKRWRRK